MVVDIGLEILVAGARLLLFAVVFRLAIYADDRLSHLSAEDAWARMEAFASAQWPGLIVQGLLIAGGFVIFSVIPEQVVTRWIPDNREATYMAILFAVKNLTVIAFFMIWMVGIIRQMLLHPLDSPAEPEPGTPNR